MEQRSRNANGTFQKGQPSPVGARRKKGVLNKITRDIREGAIAGFARHGSNGRGEGGFAGYIFFLAKRHPKAACRIIEKLLPLTLDGNGSLINNTVSTVNVISIPHDQYVGADNNVAEHQQQPPLLEHDEASAPIEPAVEYVDDDQNEEEVESDDREVEYASTAPLTAMAQFRALGQPRPPQRDDDDGGVHVQTRRRQRGPLFD